MSVTIVESGAPLGGGGTSAGTATWGTLGFNIPPFLSGLQASLNKLLELIITALDIALFALNLVKTFLKTFLDPITAIIEAIIEEIRQIIAEFREIGLYFTGDWNLFKAPYTDLLGGYEAYEQRMIARMTDRTDPTRPNVSSKTSVLGVFFFSGGGLPDLSNIQSTLDQLRNFFNIELGGGGGLPIPKLQEVRYGNDATDLLTYRSLSNIVRFDATQPNVARVSWKLETPTTGNAVASFFQPPPAGFLVTVSTLRDGLHLMYDRPRDNSDRDGEGDDKEQPREFGPARDINGKPIVLHGGADMLDINDTKFGYNSAIDSSGKVKEGRTRVYGVRSPAENTVIPLTGGNSLVADAARQAVAAVIGGVAGTVISLAGDQYLLQRTFLVDPVETGFQWVRGEYSIELKLDDMPDQARVEKQSDNTMEVISEGKADTYYVRVATVASKDFFLDPGDDNFKEWRYDLASDAATPLAGSSGKPFKVPMTKASVSPAMLSDFSEPVAVTFPNVNTAPYLESLKIALALLVLARADLPVVDDLTDLSLTDKEAAKNHEKLIEEVALIATGLEQFKALVELVYDDAGGISESFKKRGEDPVNFRTSLFRRVNTVARFLYEQTGPMAAAEKAVAEATEDLRTVKWSEIFAATGTVRGQYIAQQLAEKGDLTLLESIDTGVDDGLGTDLLEALTIEDEEFSLAGDSEFGLAMNPWSMGQGEDVVSELFRAIDPKTKESLVITHRKPHFIEWAGGGSSFRADGVPIVKELPALFVPAFLDELHPGLRLYYERHVQADGSILLDQEEATYLEEIEAVARLAGSSDRSPVFYFGSEYMVTIDADSPNLATEAGEVEVAYCRGLIAGYQGGVLLRQAALVLGVAASSGLRPPSDGAWLSRRIGDILPSLEEFLDAILNWIEALVAALASAVDALIAYIEFVEDRIIALQQFLRRLNTLLQLSFSFALSIPSLNGLILFSKGTDGLLADFIAAQNKPSESGRGSYGAGLALVAPAAPALLGDLLQLSQGSPEPGETLLKEPAEDLFNIEGLSEEELNPPSDPEPDVL